jgi:hypothetical protein
MQEANLDAARILLKTKRDLRAIKHKTLKLSTNSNMYVDLPYSDVDGEPLYLNVPIRPGALVELLDKELAYTDRMLKSFGVKELS